MVKRLCHEGQLVAQGGRKTSKFKHAKKTERFESSQAVVALRNVHNAEQNNKEIQRIELIADKLDEAKTKNADGALDHENSGECYVGVCDQHVVCLSFVRMLKSDEDSIDDHEENHRHLESIG